MIRSKFKKYIRRIGAFSLLALYMTTNAYAIDVTVRGVHFLNNEYKWIDYKLNEEDIEPIKDNLKIVENIKEFFYENVGRGNKNEPQVMRYLIANNIISRDGGFSAHKITDNESVIGDLGGDSKVDNEGTKDITEQIDKESSVLKKGSPQIEINDISKDSDRKDKTNDVTLPNNDEGWVAGSLVTDDPKLKNHLDNGMNKSDFLMGLYKSKYGVIRSRPIIFFLEPKRFINGKERVIRRIPAKEYLPKGFDFEKMKDIPVETKRINHAPSCTLTGVYDSNGNPIEIGSNCKHECTEETFTNWVKPNVDNTYFNFADDLGVYLSSNVYELYLTELLDKGIVSISDITNKKFLDEYSHNGSQDNGITAYARWSNNVTPYYPGSKEPPTMCNLYPSSPLGQGYVMVADNNKNLNENEHEKVTSLTAQRTQVNFFNQEKIRYIDALKLVERILRIEEKDLTETEAQIIAYKYGTPYINLLDKETRRTVLYLIAMGVLDSEQSNIMTNMYDILSNGQAYELFYRVANKASRKDFTKIQLTDSENFWIEKGYVENKVKIVKDPSQALPKTIGVEVTEDLKKSNETSINIRDNSKKFIGKVWDNLSLLIPAKKVYGAEINKTQAVLVVKFGWIDKVKNWWDNLVGKKTEVNLKPPDINIKPDKPKEPSKPLPENSDTKPVDTTPDKPPSKTEKNAGMVEKHDDAEEENKESDTKCFLVKKAFMTEIKGKFKDKDIKDLKEDDFNGLIVSNKIEGYTSNVGPAQRRVITFKVKSSSPVVAVAYVDSNIQIFTKKDYSNVMRTVTRVSDEDGSKFVDNYVSGDEFKRGLSEIEVVEDKLLKNKKTGDTAILLQDNKTAIVGNTVIKLKDKAVFNINKVTYYNLDVVKALLTESYLSEIDPGMFFLSSTLKSERITKVLSSTGSHIENVPVATFRGLNAQDKNKTTKDMFNLNLLTRGVTTLMKDYSIDKNGIKVHVKLIVDWSYVMPNNPNKLTTLAENKNLNLREANNFLYDRPQDPVLSEWWDSNIALSNSFCNLIFDTDNTQYVKSGYMTPSVKLLISDSALTQKEAQNLVFGNIKFPYDYTKKFLGGKPGSFLDSLFNKESIGKIGDLAKARTYEAMIGKTYDSDENCYDFGGRYVLRPSGSVFKDVQEDPRVIYADNVIRLKTRNVSSANTEVDGKYVKLNGVEYYCDGYALGGNYYRLVAKEPITGSVIKTHYNNKNGYSIGSDGKDSVVQFIKSRTSELIKDSTNNGSGLVMCGMLPQADLPEFNKFNSLVGNPVDSILVNDEFYKVSLKFGTMGEIHKSTQIPTMAHAHPVIYVDRTKYALDSSDATKLIPQKSFPFVEQGNILYSGIASGLIDAIKCKSLKNVSMSKLPQGAKVLIGDTNFTVNGNSLMSGVIDNKTIVNEVNANTDDVSKAVAKLFTGLSLDYSGRPVNFIEYISDCGLGILPSNEEGNNTLIKINDILYIKDNKTKRSYQNGELVNSVCFRINLDDAIKFRKIGNNTNYYTLVLSTDVFSEGYLGDLPFFTETLSLSLNDDLYLNLRKVTFSPLSNFNKLHEEFNQMYLKLLQGDAFTIVKVILITIVSYFIIISWMCYMVLRFRLGRSFFEVIRNPSRTDRTTGIDLIKMFSFGLFTLDEDPQGWRVFLLNIVLFLILYIVMDGFQSFIV